MYSVEFTSYNAQEPRLKVPVILCKGKALWQGSAAGVSLSLSFPHPLSCFYQINTGLSEKSCCVSVFMCKNVLWLFQQYNKIISKTNFVNQLLASKRNKEKETVSLGDDGSTGKVHFMTHKDPPAYAMERKEVGPQLAGLVLQSLYNLQAMHTTSSTFY